MGNVTSLNVWSQIIQPSKPTTLTTSFQSSSLWEVSPFAFPMSFDVSREYPIF
uniref:Uncharacterized protein n=1 Tax=Rhizophora mucronata TaxID=61149 RepID=A0A2P2QYZ2_RHIMU